MQQKYANEWPRPLSLEGTSATCRGGAPRTRGHEKGTLDIRKLFGGGYQGNTENQSIVH